MGARKSIENWFVLSFSGVCGFIIKEKLYRKVMKLRYKYVEELKHLLANNLDDCEVEEWTLAYPKTKEKPAGQQESMYYYKEGSTDAEKLKRLELIEHENRHNIRRTSVFIVKDRGYEENRKQVEEAFLKDWYLTHEEIEDVT